MGQRTIISVLDEHDYWRSNEGRRVAKAIHFGAAYGVPDDLIRRYTAQDAQATSILYDLIRRGSVTPDKLA